MAIDTISNFISTKVNLLNWVQTRVQTVSTFTTNTHIFEGQNLQYMFHFLAQIQPPAAVIQYDNSSYQNEPRANVKFSVYLACREWFDKKAGMETGLGYVDAVIAAIDHEIYNGHAIAYAKGDSWVSTSSKDTDGLTIYKLSIEIEDY